MKSLDKKVLEKVKFGRKDPGLLDVILQNHKTKQVLFGASMNREALDETMKTGFVVLFSRSRNCLWRKGETSGDRLKVVKIYLNCNNDQLLIMVEPQSFGVCHEKDESGKSRPTCFSKLLLQKV